MSAAKRKTREASPTIRVVGLRPLVGGGWRGVGPVDVPESLLTERGAKTVDDIKGIVLGHITSVLTDTRLAESLWKAPESASEAPRVRVRGVDFVVHEATDEDGAATWEAVGRVAYEPYRHSEMVRATEQRDLGAQAQVLAARDGLPVTLECARLGPFDERVAAVLAETAEAAYQARPWPYREARR